MIHLNLITKNGIFCFYLLIYVSVGKLYIYMAFDLWGSAFHFFVYKKGRRRLFHLSKKETFFVPEKRMLSLFTNTFWLTKMLFTVSSITPQAHIWLASLYPIMILQRKNVNFANPDLFAYAYRMHISTKLLNKISSDSNDWLIEVFVCKPLILRHFLICVCLLRLKFRYFKLIQLINSFLA